MAGEFSLVSVEGCVGGTKRSENVVDGGVLSVCKGGRLPGVHRTVLPGGRPSIVHRPGHPRHQHVGASSKREVSSQTPVISSFLYTDTWHAPSPDVPLAMAGSVAIVQSLHSNRRAVN